MPGEKYHGELVRNRQNGTSSFEAGGIHCIISSLNLHRSLSVCGREQHCSQQEPQMSHVHPNWFTLYTLPLCKDKDKDKEALFNVAYNVEYSLYIEYKEQSVMDRCHDQTAYEKMPETLPSCSKVK